MGQTRQLNSPGKDSLRGAQEGTRRVMNQPEKTLELKIPVAGAEVILSALSELPFKVSAPWIALIQAAAKEQLKPKSDE